MKTKLMAVAAIATAVAGGAVSGPAQARPDRFDPIFAEGGPIPGSANGISFDSEDHLYIASAFGATITKVDPDTGQILDQLTAADLVFFPDDLIVDQADDTLYWTDIALGAILEKPAGAPAQFLVPPFGLPGANPLVLSDDGSRLFAAGCYLPSASMVEIDLDTGAILNTLRADVPGCASNGLSWWGGMLYSPQPFEARVLRIDPDTGVITEVTTGYAAPVGTAFDSTGQLYAVSQGTGEVVRIDLTNPDTANNREVVTTFPIGWVDNLAFDSQDRLFVSSASDGGVVEVDTTDGSVRTVVPGQFPMPLDTVVLGDTVYTVNAQQLLGFDRATGQQTSAVRSVAGIGPFNFPTDISEWNGQLVLTSAIFGELVVYDPVAGDPFAPTYRATLNNPGDAVEFRGDLIVHETGSGDVLRLSADDLSDATVIANVPDGTGLAATGDDLYIADGVAGTVLQLVDDGELLAAPVAVIDGLATPEGMDIKGNKLYVVESGVDSLTEIHLRSGTRRTVATELGVMAPIPGITRFGFFNGVTVDGNDIFVTAERSNVIYRFDAGWRGTVRSGHGSAPAG